jgi:hypothetical protein
LRFTLIPTSQAAQSVVPTRRARLALLVVSVLATVALVAVGARHSSLSVLYLLVAATAAGVLAWLETRRRMLRVSEVIGALAVVLVVAILTPPRTSNDLWSYLVYGRMITVHGVSPYRHVPADFRSDPFFGRVSPIWRHRGSVFGPLWIAWCALGSAVAGGSALAGRLFFQGTAALASTATLVLVWRRTRSPAALIWLGLQPVFVAVAVNGGHSDVVIGLAILSSALLLGVRRLVLAGVVLGAAVLIKLTAALALIGVVCWLWHRSRLRDAAVTVSACVVTVIAGYGLVFGDAAHVLAGADHTVTQGSPWNGITDLILGSDAGRAWPNPLAPSVLLDRIWYVGAAVVVILALVAATRVALRARDARFPMATSTAAYTFGAAYSFPWYSGWALPSFADGQIEPLAWLVWIQGVVLLAALKLSSHPNGTFGDLVFRWPLTYLAPPAMLVAFAVLAVRRRDHPVVPA